MSEAAVWAPRPGFFGSIGRTLNHIFEVDLYYLDALEAGGKGRSVYARDDVRDMADLATLQVAEDQRFIEIAIGVTPDIRAKIRSTERKNTTTEERFDWLFLHLIQHQIHHRGQVHAMLSDAGVEPPQLDDFYLEFGRVEDARKYWDAPNG